MNPILIVIPILSLLMFDLGLTLRLEDFALLARRPRAVIVGLIGQIVVLPAIAFALAALLELPPLYFVGMVLIACCPGGSSSNVFSKLAGGDVALSVTLTALSSLITLLTIPMILSMAVAHSGATVDGGIHLPVGNLLVQNLVLMALPIVLGAAMRWRWPEAARRTDTVLSRIAFPALMLLAGIFFVQHYDDILANFGQLGSGVTALILLAIGVASLMARATRLTGAARRTIVIEVGMQNAAQAIAVASSPFIFNNDVIAIPAIIYALLMNVVLLTYVAVVKNRGKATSSSRI
ncbi:MAG: bile acid:sodium symporter family protein [Muribaculaceae bacterium]|nr:bile acid:sodium symporter family protein [Muribaculaceae bacterium]